MQPKPFLTTPRKCAIAIILALCWVRVFGCLDSPPQRVVSTPIAEGDATVALAAQFYVEYNGQYFGNRLPHDIEIKLTNTKHTMAETGCDLQGQNCSIAINLRYVAAPRALRGAMVHEMCHIKEWTKTLAVNMPDGMDKDEYDHGNVWRACMLKMDLQGAFREINIDYYHEGN